MRTITPFLVSLVLLAIVCGPASAKSWLETDHGQDAVEKFAHFLRFKTISDGAAPDHVVHPNEFKAAHSFLNGSFPTVYSRLKVEQVANYSLLFEWEAAKGNSDLPLALLSHQDVVPAEEGPDSPWSKPPFGGLIEDGWVYGRGAIDTKFSLIAILQAAEELLKEGFEPSRSIFFCFGHDEEVGGKHGAANLASLLANRGVELDFLVDEGGYVMTNGIPPLTSRPVAVISTAEKGFQTVDVLVHAAGGHSSRPPIDKSSVLEVMGRVLTAVSIVPPPLRLVQPVPEMLSALAPGASSSFYGYLFKHSQNRLVRPFLTKLLARWTAGTAALVRTTVAPTLARAGLQDNVLPESGSIAFNFRTLPGEDEDFTKKYLKERIGNDSSQVEIKPRTQWITGSPAPAEGLAWELISNAIKDTFTQHEGLLVTPNLLSGATDSRHYNKITKNGLYRFSGISLCSEDMARVHGIDERVKADDFLLGVKFFKRLITTSADAAAVSSS